VYPTARAAPIFRQTDTRRGMADDQIENAKAALRLKAHAARAALALEVREAAALAVSQHFFRDITLGRGEVVAAYWRIRDELDCQPILVRLMDGLQPVVLPVVLGPEEPLEMRIWEQGAALYPSGFGTLAPSELAPQAQPDVVLMPLLGFDRMGTRLGYGGGYYDRTLARLDKKPRLIGLAFAAQELDAIPRESHDVPLDAVVTETGVRHFGLPR
jgi:5-formyltetrahydrofolate cyclo-ligase